MEHCVSSHTAITCDAASRVQRLLSRAGRPNVQHPGAYMEIAGTCETRGEWSPGRA